jgi:hypothetical protein
MLHLPVLENNLRLNEPVPFQLRVDKRLLDITKQKLALARYPEEQSDFGDNDWSQGAKVTAVKELVEYWLNIYDWENKEV